MERTRSPCYLLDRRLYGLRKYEDGLAGVVGMRDLYESKLQVEAV